MQEGVCILLKGHGTCWERAWCILGEACALWEWAMHCGRGLCIMGMTCVLWEWPVYYGNGLCVRGGTCLLWEEPVYYGRDPLFIHF